MTDLSVHPDELDASIDEHAPNSMIARLRAQREQAKDNPKHLDIVLPDWGANTGGVQIIARFLPRRYKGAIATAMALVNKSQGKAGATQAEIDAACDVLITGLDQLYGRDGEDGDLEPLDEDKPLKFNQRTSDVLGLNATKAREVVYELFGGEIGEAALLAAAGRYAEFLQAIQVVAEDEGKA